MKKGRRLWSAFITAWKSPRENPETHSSTGPADTSKRIGRSTRTGPPSTPSFPSTRPRDGVKPFRINDEWYYHMRFREKMAGVTPILSDLPPAKTLVKADGSLARKNGAHSGNEFVRKAVLESPRGFRCIMAWAMQRKKRRSPASDSPADTTTGTVGHNQFRKLMLNAIVWTAKAEVPEIRREIQTALRQRPDGQPGLQTPQQLQPRPHPENAG